MPIYNATPVIYVKLQKNSPSDDPVQNGLKILCPCSPIFQLIWKS